MKWKQGVRGLLQPARPCWSDQKSCSTARPLLPQVNQSLAVLKKLHKTDIRRGEDYDHHFGSIVSCLHVMDRGGSAGGGSGGFGCCGAVGRRLRAGFESWELRRGKGRGLPGQLAALPQLTP